MITLKIEGNISGIVINITWMMFTLIADMRKDTPTECPVKNIMQFI
jgi:hypothetical protein